MIALDTNVLVRYLVEDDAKQSAAAAALIDRVIADDETLFVSDVVVCETVWVLSVSYRVGRKEIAGVLRNLLRARQPPLPDPQSIYPPPTPPKRGKGKLPPLFHPHPPPPPGFGGGGDVRPCLPPRARGFAPR